MYSSKYSHILSKINGILLTQQTKWSLVESLSLDSCLPVSPSDKQVTWLGAQLVTQSAEEVMIEKAGWIWSAVVTSGFSQDSIEAHV